MSRSRIFHSYGDVTIAGVKGRSDSHRILTRGSFFYRRKPFQTGNSTVSRRKVTPVEYWPEVNFLRRKKAPVNILWHLFELQKHSQTRNSTTPLTLKNDPYRLICNETFSMNYEFERFGEGLEIMRLLITSIYLQNKNIPTKPVFVSNKMCFETQISTYDANSKGGHHRQSARSMGKTLGTSRKALAQCTHIWNMRVLSLTIQ
jgi:hypothetical protein